MSNTKEDHRRTEREQEKRKTERAKEKKKEERKGGITPNIFIMFNILAYRICKHFILNIAVMK